MEQMDVSQQPPPAPQGSKCELSEGTAVHSSFELLQVARCTLVFERFAVERYLDETKVGT